LIVASIDECSQAGQGGRVDLAVLREQGCQIAQQTNRPRSESGQRVAARTVRVAVVMNTVWDLARTGPYTRKARWPESAAHNRCL